MPDQLAGYAEVVCGIPLDSAEAGPDELPAPEHREAKVGQRVAHLARFCVQLPA